MKKLFIALILSFIGLASTTPAAAANAPALIDDFDGWKAYHFTDKGSEVCFMSRQPDKQEGKFKKRGNVFFFVTRWSGEKDKNVVSMAAGYKLKDKSEVTVSIKGKNFSLITQGEMAWTKDQDEDNALVKELLAGAAMTVKGVSSRGTETDDTYSLKGSSGAYKAIKEQCSGDNTGKE